MARRQQTRKHPNLLQQIPEYVDPVALLLSKSSIWIKETREVREYAVHYRAKPIKVGAVAVGHKRDGGLVVASAANQNLRPGDNPTKKCAEERAIRKLQVQGVYRIAGIFVCGPPQPDTQSGLHTPTLQSCGNCRNCMRCTPEIDGETILFHVDPFLDAHEAYDVDELVAMHDTPDFVQAFNYAVDPGFRAMRKGAFDYNFCLVNGLLEPGELRPAEVFRQAIAGHLAVDEWLATA